MGTSRYIRHIVNIFYLQLLTVVPTSMAPYAIPYPTVQCTAYRLRASFLKIVKYLTQFRELFLKCTLINGSLGSTRGIFLKYKLYTKCLKVDLITECLPPSSPLCLCEFISKYKPLPKAECEWTK